MSEYSIARGRQLGALTAWVASLRSNDPERARRLIKRTVLITGIVIFGLTLLLGQDRGWVPGCDQVAKDSEIWVTRTPAAIAEHYAGDRHDPRPLQDQIIEVNGLKDARTMIPGQRLQIPCR